MKCKHNKRMEDCDECFWEWQNEMIELGKNKPRLWEEMTTNPVVAGGKRCGCELYKKGGRDYVQVNRA